MVYAIAYWNNVYGDPYLEQRDLYGGGWSTAYVSTHVSTAIETLYEIDGGVLLVYAPDTGQGFPGGFGEDGLLFTEDDPIVAYRRAIRWSTWMMTPSPLTAHAKRPSI